MYYMNTRITRFIFLLLLLIQTIKTYSQFTVNGIVKEDSKPLQGAVVSIYNFNNEKIKEITTTATGSFTFQLKYDEEYSFFITKPGYITVKILYSTIGMSADDAKKVKGTSSPEIPLFELPQDSKLQAKVTETFRKPYLSYYYSPDDFKMVSDEDIAKSMQQEVAVIQKQAFDEKNKGAAAAEIENKYKNAISKGDQALAAQNYKQAKEAYNEALAIKPGEQYPKTKIAEVDKLIAENAEKEKLAKEKEVNDKYNAAITKADKAFAVKDYAGAKSAYSEASTIKPAEQLPKEKIKEIDALVADATAKEKAEKERLSKEKELNDKYAAAISKADAALFTKNYEAAKNAYNEASNLKPNESYPKEKIAAIDKALEEIAQKDAAAKAKADAEAAEKTRLAKEKAAAEAAEKERLAKEEEKKAFERKYKQFISRGDSAFVEKDFDKAKKAYNDALEMKPQEEYPKQKLKDIDVMIANADLYKNELAKKYPQGVTEEKVKEGNTQVTRRIVVTGYKGVLYEKKETNFGAVYYFKDGTPITEQEYKKNTELK